MFAILDEWISDCRRIVKASDDPKTCEQMLQAKIRTHMKQNAESVENFTIMQSDLTVEHTSLSQRRGSVKLLALPRSIKECIIAQHELIGINRILLIKLPKAHNVNTLCMEFVKYQSNKIEQTNQVNPLEEQLHLERVMESIPFYFNLSIDHLLYPIEQKQKEQMTNADWSSVYGLEHLLRLFYHLPKIYANIKHINALQAAKISNYISLFIGYLAENIAKYVVSDLQ